VDDTSRPGLPRRRVLAVVGHHRLWQLLRRRKRHRHSDVGREARAMTLQEVPVEMV
jgi:hypothetical protein